MTEEGKKLGPLDQPFILSVPHTGTRFLKDLLKAPHNHVTQANVKERIRAKPIVCVPLRDPRKVWESWVTRHNSGTHSPDELYFEYERNWRLLEGYDKLKHMYYLPVDHKDRELYLELMARVTNKDLVTHWDPVGHEEPNKAIPNVDLSEIYSLAVVKRFYADSQYRRFYNIA